MSEETLTESRHAGQGDRRPYLVYVLSFDALTEVVTTWIPLPDLSRGPITAGRSAEVTRPVVRDDAGLAVPDRFMSSRHFVLEAAEGGVALRDAPSKNGTYVSGERVDRRLLVDGDLVQAGHSLFCYRALPPAMVEWVAGGGRPGLGPTRTHCPEVAAMLGDLQRLGSSPTSILIQGETGVGKEVAARTLHTLSGRPGPFRAVDCGAVPDTMFESTLFGHRRGAFTGATDRRVGEIPRAHGGTLFFDEIGNLTPANQAKLLRVLEERRVLPLGAEEPEEVDVRFIAATNADLAGPDARFRPDLLRRIAAFTVRVPPLRRRGEDLGVLTAHFLLQAGVGHASMTAEAGRRVFFSSFPGNIRQLRSVFQAAAALSEDAAIDLSHLREGTSAPAGATGRKLPSGARERLTRAAVEAALSAAHGNVSVAAQRLGTNRREVYRAIHGHGLALERFRE